MNGKEVVLMADLVAREKGLDIEKVLTALEAGFATALKKNYPLGSEVCVNIDPKKNSMKAWRMFFIVDKIDDYETQILIENAKKEMSDGDIIEDGVFYQTIEMNLSRQQFNITKQVALQKLKTEIKENILDGLAEKKDGILVGTVKAMKKDVITLDYSNMDVLLHKSESMNRDRFKIGDRVFFVLEKTIRTATNTILYASRKSNKFLEEVLKKEVPLIDDGKIQVKQISRINGYSSRVALFSSNPKIDVIKEVVGSRGVTAKKIKSMLNGENVDFILYSEEKTKFLINCLQPVTPIQISVDEDSMEAEIVVKEEEIEYVSRPNYKSHILNLSGWNTKFYSELMWHEKETDKTQNLMNMFKDTLDVDEDIAQTLIQMQFETLEEVAFTPTDEFLNSDAGFDEDTVAELKQRAKDALKNSSLADLEKFYATGLTKDQIEKLKSLSIVTIDNLADLDIFELEEIFPELSENTRKAIITKARG